MLLVKRYQEICIPHFVTYLSVPIPRSNNGFYESPCVCERETPKEKERKRASASERNRESKRKKERKRIIGVHIIIPHVHVRVTMFATEGTFMNTAPQAIFFKKCQNIWSGPHIQSWRGYPPPGPVFFCFLYIISSITLRSHQFPYTYTDNLSCSQYPARERLWALRTVGKTNVL